MSVDIPREGQDEHPTDAPVPYRIPGLIVEIIYRDGHRELERNLGTRERFEHFARAQMTRAEVLQVIIYEPTSQYFSTDPPIDAFAKKREHDG